MVLILSWVVMYSRSISMRVSMATVGSQYSRSKSGQRLNGDGGGFGAGGMGVGGPLSH